MRVIYLILLCLMEKGSGTELSDAVSWFKRNRTNVRKIFTINIWYVIIILSNGGQRKTMSEFR